MPLNSSLGQGVQSEMSQAYNSFAGADIKAQIGPYPFAQLQAVTFSISREKAPIYTLGSADVRSFSRNKRGIAGSLVWVNFDRHALLDVFRKAKGKFVANKDDIRPSFSTGDTEFQGQTAIFQASASRSSGIPLSAQIDDATTSISSVSGATEMAYAWMSDQIIPFDITLAGNSEYGACMAMKLLGVEILNEGGGTSVDDAVSEMQATFVARLIEPWTAVQSPFAGQPFFG